MTSVVKSVIKVVPLVVATSILLTIFVSLFLNNVISKSRPILCRPIRFFRRPIKNDDKMSQIKHTVSSRYEIISLFKGMDTIGK